MSVAIEGASVAVVGRNEVKLAEVVDGASGITAIAADIRDPDRCAGLVTEAAATSSRHGDRRERSAGVA
jgi:short-subunit dehydrogenase involved in D-alanine esterification of teichoic acids